MAPRGLDRVVIRDTDHLAHFAADLSSSLKSERFADVVFHCAPLSPIVGGKNSKAVKYPTLRVHRPVLAAISDFMSTLISPHPIEEDVHITLDATPLQVVKTIAEFAYAGEVKIPKALVATVCDAAHRLQIKFLKDSFVKITDKDYAAIKAGKKSLEAVQQKVKGLVPISPAKGKTEVKVAANANAATAADAPSGKSAGKKKGGKAKAAAKAAGGNSDTDSADSDDEKGRTVNNKEATAKATKGKGKSATGSTKGKKGAAAAAAAPAATTSGTTVVSPGAKPGNVVFTLVKQVEDPSAKTVIGEDGNFLVQFKKKLENQENRAPPPPPRIILPAQPITTTIPSPISNIKSPLPPAALPKVKKVMIPPMMRKPAIQMPKMIGGKAVASTSAAGVVGDAGSLAGSTFQLHTIRQPDGTEIQVYKQASGPSQIMKQVKKSPITVVKPASPTKVPSRLPPKDALAIAMEAIVGSKQGIKPPVNIIGMASTSAGVMLPTNPVPVSEILNPKNPTLPTKPIPSAVVKGKGKPIAQQVTVVHPPGYGASPPRKQLITLTSATAAPTIMRIPAPIISSSPASVARHSLSQPTPGIPSTVPDDFLATDEDGASSGNENGTNNGSNAAENKKDAAGKGKKSSQAANKKQAKGKSASKSAGGPPAKAAKVSAAAAVSTPAKAAAPENNKDVSVSSSGRVRKVNRKYLDKDDAAETASNSSNNSTQQSKKETAAASNNSKDSKKKTETAASKTTTTTNNSRKRKVTNDEPKSEPPVKKSAYPPPPPPRRAAAIAASNKMDTTFPIKKPAAASTPAATPKATASTKNKATNQSNNKKRAAPPAKTAAKKAAEPEPAAVGRRSSRRR